MAPRILGAHAFRTPMDSGHAVRVAGRRFLRSMALSALAPVLLLGGASGCGSCGGVNCSGEVVFVIWDGDSKAAEAASVRLCVDGDCGEAVEPTGMVSSPAGDRDEVDVVLQLLDGERQVVGALAGTGSVGSGCCPSVTFEPSEDDETLDPIDR